MAADRFRLVGLHRAAGCVLEVDLAEEAARLGLSDDTRPVDEPYVYVPVQCSPQQKK